MLESVRQELRYSLRLLRGHRGFIAGAVLALALGIGANTAVFATLDPMLWRKLPVEHPDELVLLDAVDSMGETKAEGWPVLALDQLRGLDAFAGAVAFAPIKFERDPAGPARGSARAEMVSGDYFSLLGVKPYAGRLIEPDDDRGAFGSQVAVLSYDYWRSEFKGEVAMVGKMVPIHHMTYTVVGVTPPEFFGIVLDDQPQFYIPLKAGRPLISRAPYSPGERVTIVARLRPGISAQQTALAGEALLPQIASEAEVPEAERQQTMARIVVTSVSRGISSLRERFSLPAIFFMAMAGLVLLIACANVGGLVLAEAEARNHESAVRLAPGTSRVNVVRHFLAHAFMLGLAGLIAALPLAHWWSRMLAVAILPPGSAPALTGGANGRVLLFGLAITLVAVLLCGFAAALATRPVRLRVSASLK